LLGRGGANPQGVSLRLEQSQQAPEQLGGARRAAADVQIDRQCIVDPARHRITAKKIPPSTAQSPTATTHLGSGVAS
jgi:hypothetical protein